MDAPAKIEKRRLSDQTNRFRELELIAEVATDTDELKKITTAQAQMLALVCDHARRMARGCAIGVAVAVIFFALACLLAWVAGARSPGEPAPGCGAADSALPKPPPLEPVAVATDDADDPPSAATAELVSPTVLTATTSNRQHVVSPTASTRAASNSAQISARCPEPVRADERCILAIGAKALHVANSRGDLHANRPWLIAPCSFGAEVFVMVDLADGSRARQSIRPVCGAVTTISLTKHPPEAQHD